MNEQIRQGVIAAIRATAHNDLPETIGLEHSFVLDLGFDSMSTAILALELEEQFDQAILLDGWISGHNSPQEMTVGSLCNYLSGVIGVEDVAV